MRFDLDLAPELARIPLRSGHRTLPRRYDSRFVTWHYKGVRTHDRSRAAELASLAADARYHINKDWSGDGSGVYGDGIMYDAAVLSDGAIVRLRPIAVQLWHAGNSEANRASIAIQVPVGPGQELTDPQRAALFRFTDEIRAEHGIPRANVIGHNEWPRTLGAPRPSAEYQRLKGQSECPGPIVHRALADYRATADRPATGETIRLEPAAYSDESPILGAPRATLAHAIRYSLGRTHSAYNAWDLAQVILPAYFEQAAPLGIDPILAIAQSIHETANFSSAWSARPNRNPAGIGVDGSPGAGVRFRTWTDDAIPAHLGRLLAYALAPGAGTQAQQALIAKALSYRPLPAELRGTAPTLRPLGARRNPTGRGWASPGDLYGVAIARIATAIMNTPL